MAGKPRRPKARRRNPKSAPKPGAGRTSGGGGRGGGKRTIGAGLKESSARWLRRQAKDPFVRAAKAQGYRSRAAFKLLEIDDRFHLFARGAQIADLGAAPGGWSQVAAERVRAAAARDGSVIAVDLSPMDPIAGVTVVGVDVESKEAIGEIITSSPDGFDAVLSDMAPAATGHRDTDHVRTMALAEAALGVGLAVLKPGGAFVAKVTQGGAEKELLVNLKRRFRTVRHFKPKASRRESPEIYVVATGFRGPD